MNAIIVPIREANLLRDRLGRLVNLRRELLTGGREETVHDLRVVSRRVREVLDYFQPWLPLKWHERLMTHSRTITRTLGKIREAEVNVSLINERREDGTLDSVISELLIRNQKKSLFQQHTKAIKRISGKKFEQFEEFLERLHGVRAQAVHDSTVLDKRRADFLGFTWETALDDEKLHDLRIRTKRFRYAYEIYDRLHNRNQGRFLNQIRRLQILLGDIHDLYILGILIQQESEKWQDPDLPVIAGTLQKTQKAVEDEKVKLYPQVYPLYSKILLSGQMQIVPKEEKPDLHLAVY